MSAHLQFGPEWMRKGPGKTPVTPSNESSSAIGSPSDPSSAGGANVTTGSATTPTGKTAFPGGAIRRNPSNPNTGPAPVTSASSNLPSPGAFSFAAAASGAATGHQPGSTGQPSSHGFGAAHDRTTTAGTMADADASRYSKRLLSLYSTERGMKGNNASNEHPALAGLAAPTSNVGPATSQSIGRKKGYGLGAEREPGRRSHSINTDVANAINGGGVGSASSRTFTSASSDRPDSQRPGLFQRGSSSSATATTPSTNALVSPTILQHRDRERHSSVGIQGGVLAGVTPAMRKQNKDGDIGVAGALHSAQSPTHDGGEHPTERRAASFAADSFDSARMKHGNLEEGEGHTPSRETWARLRRERLPGEGPIGPPADHSGGFARGLERRRERQASYKRSSDNRLSTHSAFNPVSAAEVQQPSVGQQTSADDGGVDSRSNDVDLSHHAATLVETLNLDDDDDDVGLDESRRRHLVEQQIAAPDRPTWSPERAEWFYRDPSGQVQGPFKATMMQDWYAAKYFGDDLLVRRAEVETFAPLGRMLQIIGNTVNPFLIPPSQYAAEQMATTPSHTAPPTPFGHQQARMGDPNHQNMAATWGAAPATAPAGPLQDVGIAAMQDFTGAGRQSPFLTNPSLANLANRSPFATPPASFAELDGMSMQRNQTEFLAMIRQREVAEQRAMQEQRNAQLAALALAQSRGDPGWSHMSSYPGVSDNWNAAAGHSHSPFQHQAQQHPLSFVQQQQQPQGWNSVQVEDAARQSPHPQSIVSQSSHLQEETWDSRTEHDAAGKAGEERNAAQSEVLKHEPSETDNHGSGYDQHRGGMQQTNQVEPVANRQAQASNVVEEDASPERLWPQSPSAVEFASEPAMEAETMSLSQQQQGQQDGMTTVKGNKKARRTNKQRLDDGHADDQQQHVGSALSSNKAGSGFTGAGGLNVVSEAQFRRNGQSQNEPTALKQHQSALSAWVPDDTPSTPSASKAAPWANSSGTMQESLSLREIQEAEARKAETQRSSQADRQHVRLPISTSSSSELPLNMSWGLASVPPVTATPTQPDTPTSASSGPVWNSGSRQAPKKTLTEIQEEERKRAMAASSNASSGTMANASLPGKAVRGYADLASKVAAAPSAAAAAPAQQGGGSGWAVVGASGKPNPSTATPATTPAPAPLRAVGNTGPARTMLPRSSSTSGSGGGGGSGVVDVSGQPQPSAEFLRHCKEQLKGLNVKVDDFIEMLLSFPLDPSPDVVEIIAESVYANSSTLDGRRFAADFVAKRKLDAAAQRNGAGGAPGLPLSNGVGGHRSAGKSGPGQTGPSLFNGTPSSHAPGIAVSPLRSASDVLRSPARSSNSSGTGSDAFGGFKVVKAKGAKKRV